MEYKAVKLTADVYEKIMKIKEILENQASLVTGTKVSIPLSEVVNKVIMAFYSKEEANTSKYKFVTVPYCPDCDVPLTPGFSGDYTVQGYTCPECGSSFPLWGPFKEAEP